MNLTIRLPNVMFQVSPTENTTYQITKFTYFFYYITQSICFYKKNPFSITLQEKCKIKFKQY